MTVVTHISQHITVVHVSSGPGMPRAAKPVQRVDGSSNPTCPAQRVVHSTPHTSGPLWAKNAWWRQSPFCRCTIAAGETNLALCAVHGTVHTSGALWARDAWRWQSPFCRCTIAASPVRWRLPLLDQPRRVDYHWRCSLLVLVQLPVRTDTTCQLATNPS